MPSWHVENSWKGKSNADPSRRLLLVRNDAEKRFYAQVFVEWRIELVEENPGHCAFDFICLAFDPTKLTKTQYTCMLAWERKLHKDGKLFWMR